MTARIGQWWPKIASGAAILAVAVVAGIISYSHIYELTLSLHQSVLTARLMPVAVDGLITVGSIVLLQGSRLGWLGIGPGLALSVFANLESGIRYGWLAATWAAIPAVSFFLASFILEHWLKGQAHSERAPGTVPGVSTEQVRQAHFPVPAMRGPEGAHSALASTLPSTQPGTPKAARNAPKPVTVRSTDGRKPIDPVKFYRADLAVGNVPSLRKIRADLKVGGVKAKSVQDRLAAEVTAAPLAA